MIEAAVRVTDLRKRYGPKRAVDGVSFSVARGEIYALLGPNGAGKTTIVEILEGFRRRDDGEVFVLGSDPERFDRGARARLGVVLQEGMLEPEFTVRETLTAHAMLFPERRTVAELLDLVDLAAQARRRVGALSGGQRRRLEIALALAGRPELVFLDEPTTGLDPEARRGVWRLVAGLAEAGATVLLTSHYMDEVEALATRLGVIAEGRMRFEGRPGDLRRRAGAGAVITFQWGGPEDHLPADWRAACDASGRVARTVERPTAALADLTGWAAARGVELEGLSVTPPALEDAYLALIADADARAA